jgi:hypothetical protein
MNMSRIDDAPRARHAEAAIAGVAIFAWPEESVAVAAIDRDAPCLLLVAPDAEPPDDWDGLTDWVRLPVDDRDLRARVATLQRLASHAPTPFVDEYDVCWRGSRWVALAPIEARIVGALLARCGSVVSRSELGAAVWPDGMPAPRALDGRLRRLRDRIEPLGISIHNVRRRGLLLEVHDAPG